jgi:class 3 adenylate cyclase
MASRPNVGSRARRPDRVCCDDAPGQDAPLSDIEGSTAHWERDHAVMGSAVARHDDIIRAAVETAGGVFVKHKGEGDSTFSVFDHAGAALIAAVGLQRAMATEPWPTAQPLCVRIGIHTGEVETRDGDYYGRTVNRAARVRAISSGSTIVVTAATATHAAHDLPDGAAFVDLGEHVLRDLADAEHLYAVGHADLPDPNVALDYLRRRAAPRVPAALRLHGDAAFVGREHELASLREAWSAAAGGQASLALVRGEAGVGKTRLAAALAEHVAETGALVLYGRCDEEPVRAYQPLAEVLAGALDRLSGSEVASVADDVAADVALVLPELRARIVVQGQPAGERYALLQAVGTLLARLAADRPTLVVLDDLHWADEPSLILLRHALRAHPTSPLHVVATYRDTDLADRRLMKWMVELRREVPTLELELHGLGRADVAQLLGAVHQDHLDAVWSASDGNPFFVTELRRTLDDDSPDTVPQSVRHSVSNRVDRLQSETQRFVRAAAVAGFDVDVAEVALAAEVDAEAADAAVIRGVLTAVDDSPGRLRFVHGLVRQAVIDELTPVGRATLHRRVASALQSLHTLVLDEYASRLAHHFFEAGDVQVGGPAYAWSVRAGRQSGQLLAYEDAEHHYRLAAEIADANGDVTGRISAELELAEVLRRSGRPAAGQSIAESSAIAATAIGASELTGWAISRLGSATPWACPGTSKRSETRARHSHPTVRGAGPSTSYMRASSCRPARSTRASTCCGRPPPGRATRPTGSRSPSRSRASTCTSTGSKYAPTTSSVSLPRPTKPPHRRCGCRRWCFGCRPRASASVSSSPRGTLPPRAKQPQALPLAMAPRRAWPRRTCRFSR